MESKPSPSQPAVHQAGLEPEDHSKDQGIVRPPADWHAMTSQPVFVVEDSFFRSRTPRPVHWSIAWSDLMMTMFILFLTLFIYQLAHRHFLDEQAKVVAGSSVDVAPAGKDRGFPFDPISPQISQKKSDPLLEVQRIEEQAIAKDPTLRDQDIPVTTVTEQREAMVEPIVTPSKTPQVQATTGMVPPRELEIKETQADFIPQAEPQDQTIQPAPVLSEAQKEIIADMYDLSKIALADEKLRRFASVEIIPDKAVRIILTGDLLFATGQAELSETARLSLLKLSGVISKTPYMINVVGHTDSVPIRSEFYPTNWELSVARASRVARFLINEIGVPEKQLVVSGFSYFRPLKPNTTEQNRRANRRVEIILSKEPPSAIPADETILR